jgi:hypothetical protein
MIARYDKRVCLGDRSGESPLNAFHELSGIAKLLFESVPWTVVDVTEGGVPCEKEQIRLKTVSLLHGLEVGLK